MPVDRKSLRILQYLYRFDSLPYQALKKRFPKTDLLPLLSVLRSEVYVIVTGQYQKRSGGTWQFSVGPDSRVACTNSGRAYVEERREHRQKIRRERMTLAIAVLALILSFLSIAWQAYTWIAELGRWPQWIWPQ